MPRSSRVSGVCREEAYGILVGRKHRGIWNLPAGPRQTSGSGTYLHHHCWKHTECQLATAGQCSSVTPAQGAWAVGTETVSGHKVRLSFPHTVKESVLGQLTSSPKLKTPSPRSPASPNVKALSCCSDTTKWHSQSQPSPVWPYKTHVTKYRNHYQNGSSTTPQYKLPLQKC